MGEGTLVVFDSVGCSLGGKSKHDLLGTPPLFVWSEEMVAMGFPGSSSHRNGIEASVWKWPDWSSGIDSSGIINGGSFGVEVGSGWSTSEPILSLSLCVLLECSCLNRV